MVASPPAAEEITLKLVMHSRRPPYTMAFIMSTPAPGLGGSLGCLMRGVLLSVKGCGSDVDAPGCVTKG